MRYKTTRMAFRYCPLCENILIHSNGAWHCKRCKFKEYSQPRQLRPLDEVKASPGGDVRGLQTNKKKVPKSA